MLCVFKFKSSILGWVADDRGEGVKRVVVDVCGGVRAQRKINT